jgi:tricorn protease
VTVVPVRDDGGLRSRAWVEGNRRTVDSLSHGRIAYVWLPNTAEDGYTYFNRYYFAQQNKGGAVIDERFNGGGSIADYMVQIMSRTLQGYFNNPVGEREPIYTPQAGILGPKVMLINEMAGSGGDMLPYLFRQMQIGPLIGARTWGGLVGIWGTPALIDGGFITAPRGGFFDLAGRWSVENEGVAPDVEVEQTPKEIIAGHDLQLERAVAEALKLVEARGVKWLKEPPPPVRVRRPN